MASPGRVLPNTFSFAYLQYQFRTLYDSTLNAVESAIQEIRQNNESTSRSRVLFHYNGHGMPVPTQLGEIWLFNKDYDKYKPISILSIHVSARFALNRRRG